MRSWNDITLYQYQQVEKINKRKDLDDIGRTLLCVCVLFNLTEYELDQMGAKKAATLCERMNKVLGSPFDSSARKKIGKYRINYRPDTLRFGQYVELQYFLQGDPMARAQYTLASIAYKWYYCYPLRRVYKWFTGKDIHNHPKAAEYFSNQPVTKVVGSVKAFIEQFTAFNAEYKSLFGNTQEGDGGTANPVIDSFNKQFGWVYAASQVAEHKKISLDNAMMLPVREALYSLSFLKALGQYHTELSKS